MKSIPQYLRAGLFSVLFILSMYSHPAQPAGAKTSVKETGNPAAPATILGRDPVCVADCASRCADSGASAQICFNSCVKGCPILRPEGPNGP
jgi:hypothetical protein